MKRKFSMGFIFVAVILAALATGPVFGEGGGKGPPEDLKVQARPVFEIEGVIYTDAKDSGIVEIGVANKGIVKAVENRLKQLGVPLSSVAIVETKPIAFVSSLQDYVRPLEGGLQIAFVDGGFAYYCTMGFNAVRNGVNGFVVNSHCTADQFKVDGTSHYQPWLSPSSNIIGSEIADPSSFRCNVRGKKCRYSDAAYDQLSSGVAVTLGSIARPDGVNNGSLNIVGSFNVDSEAPGNAPVGTSLNKVGRTTGWTQGAVTNSCVDTGVSGTNILLLCQDFVSASVGGGDSGSPVFKITSGNNVTLQGILWGGASDGSMFVYSPIANVESELGALTTFGAPPSDNTPPALVSAEVDATTLVLTHDEALDTVSVPATGDFTVGTDGAAQSVTGVGVSGADVTLTLSPGVASGDTITVSYTAGSNPIQDAAGNDADNLTNQSVTNNTPAPDITAPALLSAAVSASPLVLTYNEALDSSSVPTTGDFTIGTDGAAQSVTGVDVSGADVTLTVSPGVASGDAITVSYTAGSNPIQDAAGNDAASVSNHSVTNNTPAPGADQMGVFEISWKSKKRNLDFTVYVRQDSDVDGALTGADSPVAAAHVNATLTHDFNGNGEFEDCSIDTCWANFGGDTGTNGSVRFSLVGGAPNGLYQLEVTGLTHVTQVWNTALDADNPDTFTR